MTLIWQIKEQDTVMVCYGKLRNSLVGKKPSRVRTKLAWKKLDVCGRRNKLGYKLQKFVLVSRPLIMSITDIPDRTPVEPRSKPKQLN